MQKQEYDARVTELHRKLMALIPAEGSSNDIVVLLEAFCKPVRDLLANLHYHEPETASGIALSLIADLAEIGNGKEDKDFEQLNLLNRKGKQTCN